jgi:hypothetical protein
VPGAAKCGAAWFSWTPSSIGQHNLVAEILDTSSTANQQLLTRQKKLAALSLDVS